MGHGTLQGHATDRIFRCTSRLEQLREMEDPILRLHEAVDWEMFRPVLSDLTRVVAKGPGGQKPFDPLMMFKALILGRPHNLSDHALERQIRKDLTFMAFGLTLADRVPDEKTLWEFREKIGGGESFTQLFARFNAHLHEQGHFTKQGCIVDATFVEVPIQRNGREDIFGEHERDPVGPNRLIFHIQPEEGIIPITSKDR